MSHKAENAPNPPRAYRYALRLPLRYRKQGNSRWYEGLTLNLSTSGVLFGGKQPIPAATTIELYLLAPQEGVADIRAEGIVVRSESGKGVPFQIAARIIYYELIPSLLTSSGSA